MASKSVQIAPIQQILPVPPRCEITIRGDTDFQYAVASQSDLDDNKFSFQQSTNGQASIRNDAPSFLVLKSNTNICNATISIVASSPPVGVPPSQQTLVEQNSSHSTQPYVNKPQIVRVTPSETKNRNISLLLWVGLAALIIYIINQKKK